MKRRNLTLLLFTLFVLSSFDLNICRRHDKNDSLYLEKGKAFKAVCKVGRKIGDGTLIHPRWVLTAAHVVEALEEDADLKVYFGKKSIAIEEIIVHPEYEFVNGHDIALLRLKSIPKGIQHHKLYNNHDEKGQNIVIVGHGDAKAGNSKKWEFSDGKRRAATNTIERVTDNHLIFNFSHPESKSSTSLEGTAGAGDSGGPAFIELGDQYFVAGVSSAGYGGSNGPGTYGAVENYIRVSTHREWIESYVQ